MAVDMILFFNEFYRIIYRCDSAENLSSARVDRFLSTSIGTGAVSDDLCVSLLGRPPPDFLH